MPNYPQQVLNFVLDTIFPKTCLGCGDFTDDQEFGYLCRKCLGKIKVKSNFECIGCKREVRRGFTCFDCRKSNYVDQLLVASDLKDGLIDKAIKTYKYKFLKDLSRPISSILRRYVKALSAKGISIFEDNPLLVPMPLHRIRLNERGFNQSQLLAKELADFFHVSFFENVLRRVSKRKHQADIKSKEERLGNTKDNFAIDSPESVVGRTVILVDDICTTGATLNECAKVLKENGAKKVIGFVVARG